MILIEKPQDLFATRLATLSIKDDYIYLTFDEPFYKGRGKPFKKDDYVARQFFSTKEISTLQKEFKIQKLPFEIYNQYQLEDIYDFVKD